MDNLYCFRSCLDCKHLFIDFLMKHASCKIDAIPTYAEKYSVIKKCNKKELKN